MTLIENWRAAPKMLSVQMMTLAVALQSAYAALPAPMQATVPPAVMQILTVTLLLLGIVGRVVAQPSIDPAPVPADDMPTLPANP